ncbi:hypothetical protein C8Q73DRAFT_710852 [Cubamyces lactineus]|nr:hypothetical protein C8Q73DRAFT_710852 [Cubamyces lactineus]
MLHRTRITDKIPSTLRSRPTSESLRTRPSSLASASYRIQLATSFVVVLEYARDQRTSKMHVTRALNRHSCFADMGGSI